MSARPLVWIGLFVGSTIGGLIPSLWGGDMFSPSGILFSGIGACLGIYLGFKVSQNM